MLTIDATLSGEAISRQLFGHNLEHTRKALWQGISAEMVANRKFAALDGGRPMRWHMVGGHGVSIDGQAPFASGHSVRLDPGGDGDAGIWQQHDWLTFEAGREYAFQIWAKADQEQELRLKIVTRDGFSSVFSGNTVVQAGDWMLWDGTFVSPVLAKGTRLALRVSGPASLWIGAVSLMPSDHFHGMRRDVVDLLKRMKPGNLRWPGGCFAEYYPWRDGLLPVDKRPPIGPHKWVGLLPDSDGFDNHEIGIDEFVALCRKLDCEPHITTRYGGDGSFEEAASWVEYCNGSEDTHWGGVRARRGQREPYGVKHWYVGNEIWGMSLVKNKEPEACAATSAAYAEAMKKVDPTIILNCGVPAEARWLKPQFERAAGLFKRVQHGFYFNPQERYAAGADRILAAPALVLEQMRALRQLVDKVTTSEKPVGLSLYEWNVMWDRGGDVLSGVFAAKMLNLFCREAEALGLVAASYFQPVTEGAIRVGPTCSELEPDGEVFALYAAHQGNRLIRLAGGTTPAIDACASVSPDGCVMFITLVNGDIAQPREVVFSLQHFDGLQTASAVLLVSDAIELGADVSRREETLPILEGGQVRLTIPAFSVAGVWLRGGRNC